MTRQRLNKDYRNVKYEVILLMLPLSQAKISISKITNHLSMRILSFILLAASCVSSAFLPNRDYMRMNFLSDVRLLDSPFRHAMELNTDILLSYDTDRLLAHTRLPKRTCQVEKVLSTGWPFLTAIRRIICRHG